MPLASAWLLRTHVIVASRRLGRHATGFPSRCRPMRPASGAHQSRRRRQYVVPRSRCVSLGNEPFDHQSALNCGPPNGRRYEFPPEPRIPQRGETQIPLHIDAGYGQCARAPGIVRATIRDHRVMPRTGSANRLEHQNALRRRAPRLANAAPTFERRTVAFQRARPSPRTAQGLSVHIVVRTPQKDRAPQGSKPRKCTACHHGHPATPRVG